MSNKINFFKKILFWFTMIFILCSCSSFIPTSGPSVRKIEEHAQQLANSTVLIDVDHRFIEQKTKKQQSFSDVWQSNIYNGSLGIGDVVKVTIWESPPAVLFSGPIDQTGSGNAHVTELPQQIVDHSGTVNIPFVGSVRAQGKTPAQLANEITNRLKNKANQPQVVVNLLHNHSAAVIVIRDGKSIQMPLSVKGERILDAITAIGGVSESIHKTSLQLTRGQQVHMMSLTRIINDPHQNIILQSGDVLTVLYQPLNFVVLGATGKNQELSFEADGITLAQALGRTGGLNDNRANVKGIFVFRYENLENIPPALSSIYSQSYKQSKAPVVYRIDLQNPDSFFYVQNFMVQDKDILYVSNAPATELQKFFRAVFSWLSPVISTTNAVN